MPNPNDVQNLDLDNLDGQNQDDESSNQDSDNNDQQDDVTNQNADNQDNADVKDDSQYFVSDEEYLAPYYAQGMPNSIKSLDDAMNWAVNLAKGQQSFQQSPDSQKLQKLNQLLAQNGIYGGVDEYLATGGNTQYRNDNQYRQNNSQYDDNRNQQSFLPKTPFRQLIDAEIEQGRITQEQAPAYRAYAQYNDRALQQVTEPIVNALKKTLAVVQAHEKTLQEQSWRMLPRKIRDNVQKFELDAVINSGQAQSYEDAFIIHGRLHKPHLLAEYFSQKGQGQMNNNGNGKRPQSMSRQNLNQRQQQDNRGQTGSLNIDKFILPDGQLNNAALDKLKPEDAAKMRREILRKANLMR